QLSIINYLLEYGADINKKNNIGHTPLHCACEEGYETIMRILVENVEHDVDINKNDNTGETLLHYAYEKGSIDWFILSTCPIVVIDLTEDEVKDLPAIQYNSEKKIRSDYKVTKARPSGVGKNNKALEIATEWETKYNTGTDMIKFLNRFYLGTTRLARERRVEVIDMFPPESAHVGEYPVDYRTNFNELEEYEITNDWDNTLINDIKEYYN
ncbi:hypothetical protein PIROE2DRAFT_14854, partial [Piromyces sp. E2]